MGAEPSDHSARLDSLPADRGNCARTLRILPAALLATAVMAVRPVPGSPLSPAPAVIVVSVDGLEPEDASPALMPNLFGLLVAGEARRWTNAQAVMVSETNPNHTAMLTGTYGDLSGLFANSFFNLRSGRVEAMERPSLILVPTLFDAIEAQNSSLRTASIMGKEKLRRLFDCTTTSAGVCGPSNDNPEGITVTHVRPDFVGGASGGFDPDAIGNDAVAEPASGSGYSLDNQVMEIVIAQHADASRPAFTFVNLADVDGIEHIFGARSPQAMATVANADVALGRLVGALREGGRWSDTVLFVTADHSFQDTGNPVGTDEVRVANAVTPHVSGSLIVLSELLGSCSNQVPFAAVGNGGSASVFITEEGYDPYAGTPLTQVQRDCLVELRARALANPGVDEALYRLPVVSETSTLLRPEWRLDSPRAGELFLTAKNHATFANSRTSTFAIMPGNHGGPTALPIPFFVASGSSMLVAGTDTTHSVERVDLAPTVSWLLGIDPPAASEGRVLCEAFSACP